MFFSPSSPPTRLPDSVSSSTPNSGTFSAARTRLNYGSEQNLSKTRLSLKKKLPFPRSVGGLAELADDVKEEIRFRGQRSGGRGDHRRDAAAGGAVRHGQLKGWTEKQFYGDVKKEDLNEKINRVTSNGQYGSSKFVGGDFNLNFSLPEDEQETDMLDTIDLSSPSTSPCTTPPPALQQKVLPHSIGFKNYGNTCYMNAVTQALLGLNIFVRKMITRQRTHADGDQGLLQAFSELCLACSKGEMVSANQGMVEMKKQFELVDKQFEGNQMQDASEFLCRALEKMSEIELPRHPELSVTTQELNIIENHFLHQKEETIVCRGCKSETKCKHSDMTMWCDTVSLSSMTRTRCMSLQQLLEQSLAEEMIERRCEKCGCDEATTFSRLVKMPRVLVVILKRYRYNEQDQTSSNKVSRLVDIPKTVSLTSLVSVDATLPSPSLSLPSTPAKTGHGAALPSTPAKTGHGAARVETPFKFMGLGVGEVGRMNEEDQLEYTMYVSRKEAVHNLMNQSGADEDAELKAALEASMVDDHLNHSDKSGGSSGRTPARKRSYGQLGGGMFTDGDGDKSRKKLDKAMDYIESKEFNAGKESVKVAKKPKPRVRRSPRKKVELEEFPHPKSKEQEEADLQEALDLSRSPRNKVELEEVPHPKSKEQEAADLQEALDLSRSPRKKVELEEFPHPKSKEQEEADFQEALDLSRQEQESVFKDVQFQWGMEDVENNNMEEVARPEHTYQLHSVVSHHGASAGSGHYVADVFRFDVGGWRRYDDARVTTTDGLAVRTGANTTNGYILTYLHQAAWEEGTRVASSHGNM